MNDAPTNDSPTAADLRGKRIVGLDYGRRRVGTAVCDELHITVSAREVLHRDNPQFWEQVCLLAERERAAAIVVGVPYRHDGAGTELIAEIEQFITETAAITGRRVIAVDEAFSSRRAMQTMIAAGVKKQQRAKKGTTDSAAAVIILRDFLEQP